MADKYVIKNHNNNKKTKKAQKENIFTSPRFHPKLNYLKSNSKLFVFLLMGVMESHTGKSLL